MRRSLVLKRVVNRPTMAWFVTQCLFAPQTSSELSVRPVVTASAKEVDTVEADVARCRELLAAVTPFEEILGFNRD